jgi:hypothetical protein
VLIRPEKLKFQLWGLKNTLNDAGQFGHDHFSRQEHFFVRGFCASIQIGFIADA